MTAAIIALMPRAQVIEKAAGINAATEERAGALSVEQCAMYRQQASMLRQMDALACKSLVAEQSHGLLNLQSEIEAVRSRIGAALYKIYDVAARAPDSRFLAAREERNALRAELWGMLCPPR